jgi:hypothetical protein
MALVPLANGPNEVDIDGDGEKDLVFVGRWENYNAHSSNEFAFYAHYRDQYLPELKWYVVPFFDKRGALQIDLRTQEGADCILRDIRILSPASENNRPVTVIVGTRDFGKSFADSASVRFIVYELMRGGVPGFPPLYFQEKQTIKVKTKYCDINAAFLKELGINDYRNAVKPRN